MNPLLQQFLSEARDFLQGIAEKLMQLEKAPADVALMTELFRFVHTLKGNSGLFEFPEMTRVLHAGEDLLDAVRNGQVSYSQELADRLLDAMDFVGMLCDEIEQNGAISASYASDSARLTESLRKLMVNINQQPLSTPVEAEAETQDEIPVRHQTATGLPVCPINAPEALANIPEAVRMAAYASGQPGTSLHWLAYTPDEQCFFQGEDPFYQARHTPGLIWGGIVAREAWPKLAEMDAYRCVLDFHVLTAASQAELDEYYRYMADRITSQLLSPWSLIIPAGDPNGGPVYEDFVGDALELLDANDLPGLERAAQTMLELSSPDLWFASALRWLLLVLEHEPDKPLLLATLIESLRNLEQPNWLGLPGQVPLQSPMASVEPNQVPLPLEVTIQEAKPDWPEPDQAVQALLDIQRQILQLPITEPWEQGRMRAAITSLTACLTASGSVEQLPSLALASEQALAAGDAQAILSWLDSRLSSASVTATAQAEPQAAVSAPKSEPVEEISQSVPIADPDGEIKFGRRAEDLTVTGAKSVKVDQVKIDRLMNLIGEMVVSKNALPYLAGRAEAVFGVRELSREIKAQYAVINRIAEEMQDAIMQVRMMPVSFVFQRFPRLVRDTARKLGKDINLILEGEDTEADKNIIESLGDPLVHIVRNSLDHGFELPEVRRAIGKPATGTLTIRATQESDRVIIEIIDDGKGIDPDIVKRKAYEKGILDEAALERISDQDAVNLVFAAGFSTAEVISDLSGRGVGMDVVRTAVEKVNGAISLDSEKGKGTRIRLSLPLSMAVTNVMIIESDAQLFGVPMDSVVETVRVPRANVRTIKHSLATVLRGRIVPLKSINSLLNIAAPPLTNDDDELAVLVVRLGDESVGLLVDDFRETVDIILKPLAGVLGQISAYAGSALMGDGSVLMVLNVKELL
ncbi:MAG: chemotaxis protein CheA [Proteobacteria bacterium ST_bin11]|nr:MAG: chemotaxis protein CheA [Proteobacteria bacterium ST_bin11]